MAKGRTVTVIVALLALVAGCGGSADTVDDTADESTAQGSSGTIQVEAGDLFFEPEQLSAQPGDVVVALNNSGALEHDFVVEEAGDTEVARATAGETAEGTINLEPGTYTFYCSIAGHRESGMEGTLEVN